MPSRVRPAARGQLLSPPHVRVGIACLLHVPIATWFLLGDMSEPGGLDRIYAAPELPRPLEMLLGLLSAGSLVIGLRFLIPRTRHSGERAWWSVFGVLAVVGVTLAFGLRVLTARVGGANIGGGLFLMYGLPVVSLLVLWALARAWTLTAPSGSDYR